MRLIHALPLIAAAALAACGDDVEEGLTDDELAAGDVAPVIDDNGVMPTTGEYTTVTELASLDVPNATDAGREEMRAAFEEGAAEPYLFCVTEEMTRADWLSAISGSDCSLTQLNADGNSIEGTMNCTSGEVFEGQPGLNGPVEFSGTTGERGSELRMSYQLPQNLGTGTVEMRVRTEPTGEACS